MKIKIESTDKLTKIDGVPVRLWEGETESGTKCKVFIHRIAVHNDADATQFEKELKEQLQPGRMVHLRQII
jgi:hypothetical protein